MVKEQAKERYSFSKLNTFLTCKYGYKLKYIDHRDGIGNCFSSYGTEIHSIMERYAKGEIGLWELVGTFEKEFESAVPEPFPKSKFCKDMRSLYYNQAIEFLSNFPGYGKKEILGAEKEFDLPIDDWIFTGVIDLIYKDNETGELTILDYKSKANFKNKKEQAEYARQLYLYSLHVKELYGKFPDKLRFLMFRKNTYVNIPFSEKELDEAICWAKNTVQSIRDCWDYSPTCEEFYSQNLCNFRLICKERNRG